MAKLLYSATVSLDGFIAGPGGDASWMTPYLGPDPAIDEVIGQIGALLVGHRTFRGGDPHEGTAKEGRPFGGWSGPQVVITHTPLTPRCRRSPSSPTSIRLSRRRSLALACVLGRRCSRSCSAHAPAWAEQIRHSLKYLSSTVPRLIRRYVPQNVLVLCYDRTSK